MCPVLQVRQGRGGSLIPLLRGGMSKEEAMACKPGSTSKTCGTKKKATKKTAAKKK